MSEQTVKILIRLLLRSSLIRIYTVCHSFYIFWRHYFIVKLNCFILRTITVAGLGVPIFRVFTVSFAHDLRSHNRDLHYLRINYRFETNSTFSVYEFQETSHLSF